MASRDFLFTSESVSEGHPDKIADQISDAVLDGVLKDDPLGHVACETLITTGLVVVSGEITTSTYVDVPSLVRSTIERIGYTRAKYGFDSSTCGVVTAIHEQSPDIAQGVRAALESRVDPQDGDLLDAQGAGDQGMMFGYACRDTEELMPMPILLAHRLVHRMSEVRKGGVVPYLRPDGKSQVTVRYVDGKPEFITAVVVSTQHKDGIDIDTLMRPDLIDHVIKPVLPEGLYDPEFKQTKLFVNPTGKFVVGGPMGDTGLTGRKIIVDTYGGFGRHGGGAFSGKDPSKVDRSGGVRRPLRGEERRGGGTGRSLRDPDRIRDRRGSSGQHHGGVLRHREGGSGPHRRTGAEPLRPEAGGHHPRSEAAAAHLREDGRLRSLRPRRCRLHLGEHRQGRGSAP